MDLVASYLNVTMDYLGYIDYDEQVVEACEQMRPTMPQRLDGSISVGPFLVCHEILSKLAQVRRLTKRRKICTIFMTIVTFVFYRSQEKYLGIRFYRFCRHSPFVGQGDGFKRGHGRLIFKKSDICTHRNGRALRDPSRNRSRGI